MAAAKYKLDNLCGIVDLNGLQIDGATADVMPTEPLDKKWESFGWYVQSVDGHNVEQIVYAIDNAKKVKNKPSMILLNTIKGKGCSFCENMLSSHSVKNITEGMWKEAIAKLDGEDV